MVRATQGARANLAMEVGTMAPVDTSHYTICSVSGAGLIDGVASAMQSTMFGASTGLQPAFCRNRAGHHLLPPANLERKP